VRYAVWIAVIWVASAAVTGWLVAKPRALALRAGYK